jgi:hypothetical protein
MNIATIAHRFFLFGGALLIFIAIVQLRLRRRAKDSARTPIDANVVRMILFGVVGALAILIGAGVIPMARLR